MVQNDVIINCESIKDGEVKLLNKIDEIKNILTDVNRLILDSKDFFDTPTATLFREKINEYIHNNEKEMDSNIISYINSLDDIIKIYNDVNIEINEKVKL